MNFQPSNIVVTATLLLALTACKEQQDQKTESNLQQDTQSSVPIQNTVTDQWLGQWNGPEGTFLKLTRTHGNYEVIIQNLDGPQHYTGIALNNEIQFERNGIKEKIRATNGAETGMKWLSEKSNCLTIQYGEGFCRD